MSTDSSVPGWVCQPLDAPGGKTRLWTTSVVGPSVVIDTGGRGGQCRAQCDGGPDDDLKSDGHGTPRRRWLRPSLTHIASRRQ